jgi:hypothetical protein
MPCGVLPFSREAQHGGTASARRSQPSAEASRRGARGHTHTNVTDRRPLVGRTTPGAHPGVDPVRRYGRLIALGPDTPQVADYHVASPARVGANDEAIAPESALYVDNRIGRQ